MGSLTQSIKFKSNQLVFPSHACVESVPPSSNGMASWFLKILALSFAGHGCGLNIDSGEMELPLRKWGWTSGTLQSA